MEESQNPWFSIWTEPRATIAKIVEKNPNRSLWILAWIYGFCSLMNMFQSMALGTSIGTFAILILAIIIAPIYGYINFCVWSWFVMWVGKLFKGQGQFKSVRSAYTWSCVPITLNVPLWLLMVIVFGHQLFLNLPNAHLISGWRVFLLFIVLIAKVVLSIWSLVIYVNALAEVQKYSILRSILNIIVALILIAIIFYILWNLLAYVSNVGVSPFIFLKLF